MLGDHVTLDPEGIDKLDLNLYQPWVQTGGWVANFFKECHRRAKVPSSVLMAPISHAFVKAIHEFAKQDCVEIVTLGKGQRKGDVTREHSQSVLAHLRMTGSSRRRSQAWLAQVG